MNNKKNVISALVLQLVTMLQGLILPRLILLNFGSEINGLVNSITQFLSFVSLLEGGLGAVVLSELYSPISRGDENRTREILSACQTFFYRLSLTFLVYTIVIAIIYPCFIVHQYSFAFTSSLVLVLSLITLAQYMFSITYRLYLQADQRLYIVNIISIITILVNTVSAVVVMRVFPHIHAVKLCSGVIYLLQPIAFQHYVEKKYRLPVGFHVKGSTSILKNRWSGFLHNLAHFVNRNIDIVILTLFSSLSSVSVYTVYMLAISALRGIISNVGNSYQAAIGKYVAEGDTVILREKFERFESVFWFIGVTLFSTCLLLINSFVGVYTAQINDADYFQPVFGAIIVLANLVYVIREPYRLLILAAGKFKETNFGAIAEVVINIVISVSLVWKYGLIGVAVGTLAAILFRLIYFMWFLKRDILFRGYRTYFTHILCAAVVVAVDMYIYFKKAFIVTNVIPFCVAGCALVAGNALLYAAVYYAIRLISKGNRRGEIRE